MKREKSVFFIFMSALLTASGLCSIVMCILIFTLTKDYVNAPKVLIIASAVIAAIYGILECLTGISGLNKSRRIASKQCIFRARITIVLSIISIILILIIRIKLVVVLLMFISGILVPIFYIISTPSFVDRKRKKA